MCTCQIINSTFIWYISVLCQILRISEFRVDSNGKHLNLQSWLEIEVDGQRLRNAEVVHYCQWTIVKGLSRPPKGQESQIMTRFEL